MRRLLALGLAALTFGACSFIIDVDKIRRERDGGAGGSGPGGGAGGTGGGDAGGMGGMGGGSAGSGGYDGGAACSSSPRPRLRCDAPVTVATGIDLHYPMLAAVEGRLISAWANTTRVIISRMELDGGTQQLLEAVDTFRITRLMLAAEGDVWAAVTNTGTARPLLCYSSFSDAGVIVTTTDNLYEGAAVAVSARGDIAVASGADTFRWEIANGGCPTSVRTVDTSVGADYVGAVHLPDSGPEGFRFTTTSFGGTDQGQISVLAALDDGGIRWEAGAHTIGYGDHVAALSSNGIDILLTLIHRSNVGGTDRDILGARTLPVAVTPFAPQMKNITGTPRWWTNSICGPGCFANTWLPLSPPSHVSVALWSDDNSLRPKTASDAGWDVVCSTAPNQTEVAVAWAGGRLHFLVTEAVVAKLYSCDLPPL